MSATHYKRSPRTFASVEALRRSVRRALRPPHAALSLGACALATTLAVADELAPAAVVFPAVVDLDALDGSTGFVTEHGIAGTGASVSGAGDVNGDGIDDMLLGASVGDTYALGISAYYSGTSYIVPGRPAAFPAVVDLNDVDEYGGMQIDGYSYDDFSAWSVSGGGDLNGDGFDDVILGTPYAESVGGISEGETYVVFGQPAFAESRINLGSLFPANGGDGSVGFVLKGVDGFDESGWSVSHVGDVNGDGVDDLVIGAPFADPHLVSSAGEAYVVFGRTGGFPPVFTLRQLFPAAGGNGRRGFVIEGFQPGGDLGLAVSDAGDVNADGIDDLLIGGGGETYVVFGRRAPFRTGFNVERLLPPDGGDGSEGFVLIGDSPLSVSAAGDVNGDGIDDIVLGAADADPDGRTNAGGAFVVFGRSTIFPPLFELRTLLPGAGGDGREGFFLKGIDANDLAGSKVSGAGDLNGDGLDDLVINAPEAEYGDDRGEGYVVFGRATRFPPAFQLSSLQPPTGDGSAGFVYRSGDSFGSYNSHFYGEAVSDAGDVNGDGTDDLLIGAPSHHKVYVLFGRAQPALDGAR